MSKCSQLLGKIKTVLIQHNIKMIDFFCFFCKLVRGSVCLGLISGSYITMVSCSKMGAGGPVLGRGFGSLHTKVSYTSAPVAL